MQMDPFSFRDIVSVATPAIVSVGLYMLRVNKKAAQDSRDEIKEVIAANKEESNNNFDEIKEDIRRNTFEIKANLEIHNREISNLNGRVSRIEGELDK